MDETLKQIITYLVTFVGGYLSRYLEPHAQLVHWFPGWVTFPVPLPAPAGAAQQTMNVSTHALTIQNVGWRPATNVEIVHGQSPQLFRFIPQINFSQAQTPSGEHVNHDCRSRAARVGDTTGPNGWPVSSSPKCQKH